MWKTRVMSLVKASHGTESQPWDRKPDTAQKASRGTVKPAMALKASHGTVKASHATESQPWHRKPAMAQ